MYIYIHIHIHLSLYTYIYIYIEREIKRAQVLPTFMLPRACMGIVVRFFLDYRGDASTFPRELSPAKTRLDQRHRPRGDKGEPLV